MIEYIKGELTELTPAMATVEAAGVGYGLNISLTTYSAIQNKKDEGKVFDVLVEGFSKRSREQLCGRTEQNKMVVFDKGNHHIGETVRVRITGSTSATLIGESV